MNNALTQYEFAALAEVARGIKTRKVSPDVAKCLKHLFGLKYVSYGRNGQVMITDSGRQALFLNSCIDGLREVLKDSLVILHSEVRTLLEKKGHIRARAEGGGFEVTQKGIETLADIDAVR